MGHPPAARETRDEVAAGSACALQVQANRQNTVAVAQGVAFAVRTVPASIYSASCAIRIFCRARLLEPFQEKYELVEECTCALQADPQSIAVDFLLRRKPA